MRSIPQIPFASDDYRRSHRLLLLLILAHVIVVALFTWIARSPGAVWDDMLEAWSWGQQFDLGYYKHPPLFAWVVGLWLRIFPHTDLSLYTLSAFNIGLALAGIWRISGLLLKKYARVPAISLLLFAPSYHYFATNFNANTIQLSIWAWAAFFFLRSLRTNSWKDGVWFGALGACALLSKYYSILFLGSCFVSALLHPHRPTYFRSPAPYVAVATCAVLFAPHAWWVWESGWSTINYALGKTTKPVWFNMYSAITAGVVGVVSNAASTVVLLAALGWRWPALFRRLLRSVTAPNNLWLSVLALGPLFLTLLVGILGLVKIDPKFLIPTVYLLPLLVSRVLGGTMTVVRVDQISRWAALFLLVGILVVAPAVAYASVAFHFNDRLRVSPQVAKVATNAWHERMSRPLRIATGTEAYSLALPFYSPDGPAEFTHYSFAQAPWITAERISREGILFACDAKDLDCRQAAMAYATPQTVELPLRFQNTFWGLHGPEIEVVLFMTPPV
jgi:4-amino-4-deoxy-L-arabinose transferase-like glycosyltransferase